MTDEDTAVWFTFTVLDTDVEGVEIPKLARLLERLSSAFYHIARGKLGAEESRPGPRTQVEDSLAAVRLLRVTPGSTSIELAPPSSAVQAHLDLVDFPTADDVALEFVEEVRLIAAGKAARAGGLDVRKRVREVVEDAGEIGARAEIAYRPLTSRPNQPADETFTAEILTRDLPAEPLPEMSTRTRRISGHAFMVDVEPGRPRMRVKMPDGRDVTLPVADHLLSDISSVLDQVVEIEIEEELEGATTAHRLVRGIAILPAARDGNDQPPRSIQELAREQGLPKKRPDYVRLASGVWPTEEDISAFEEHLSAMRARG